MRWSIARTLFRKDLLEALRDRRTLALLVAVPLLLYPLLLVVTALTSGALARSTEEKPLKLVVWGSPTPMLQEALKGMERVEWAGVHEKAPGDAPREAKRLLDERKAHVVLALTPDSVERALGTGSALEGTAENLGVRVYFDSGRPESRAARKRLGEVLDQVHLDTVRVRFEEAGMSGALAAPLQVEDSDFRSLGLWLAYMLPYVLLCALVMSGFYPAIDVTAGEKERGTLQTLLCAPVKPLEVVLGKYGVVSLFTLGGALMNLLGMGLAFMAIAGGTVGRVHMSAGMLAAAFGALVPLAMLVSALLIAVGVTARSFKEGQNHLMPVLLGVMVLAHGAMIPSVELTPKLALVPIVNVAVLLRELLTGRVDVGLYSVVFVSTLAWAVAGVLFAARVFESEQVLLSGERPWRDVFGRKVRRGDDFSPGSALLYFAIILVGSLFAGILLRERLPLWGLLAVIQVGVFLVPAVWWVRHRGADVREVFSLRPPSRRGALAVLLLVPGVLGMQSLLSKALKAASTPGLEEFLRVLELLMKESASWPLPLALAALALTPALCEEAACRGVMLVGLSRTGSRVVAVAGSALAFGLLHIHPIHVLHATILGLVLGYATLRTRSLLAGVVLHFANNALSVVNIRTGTAEVWAWMDTWPVALALCVPGWVALWLLRGEEPVPDPAPVELPLVLTRSTSTGARTERSERHG
ncbi:ABC transporter permease subunit/CPBP intramembrane protease [Archangium lipolyticum]|uniref:ABC transporter permease subunit/CPBP intramembrane protease n=1 Tax=Archangium lipolyticum TaxID=2970465 RepID=UPI00214A20D8|nr:ABC transporter permease subunit/CPBP intramembrane protease [Archangium lipolyticum]